MSFGRTETLPVISSAREMSEVTAGIHGALGARDFETKLM